MAKSRKFSQPAVLVDFHSELLDNAVIRSPPNSLLEYCEYLYIVLDSSVRICQISNSSITVEASTWQRAWLTPDCNLSHQEYP